MKNQGKVFESNFKKSVPNDVYFLRLHDSSPAGYGGQETMRFSQKSPYDVILFKHGTMYALELKSTKGKSISFCGSSPMIKRHQIDELIKASQFGIKAGFVFDFRNYKTFYVPIVAFSDFMLSTDKKSINQKEVEVIGVEIPKKLLKVNYRYDLGVIVGKEEE